MANEQGRELEVNGGFRFKTQPSSCHEDLPWDAWVLKKDGSIFAWADGYTEEEAARRALAVTGAKILGMPDDVARRYIGHTVPPVVSRA